jgi:phosphomannomutase
MQTLRSSPPASLGGIDVASVDDLVAGYRGLPPTDGIRLGLGENARIICRPSGTEPKIKCYVEVVVPVGDSMEVARDEAQAMIDGIKADLADALGL